MPRYIINVLKNAFFFFNEYTFSPQPPEDGEKKPLLVRCLF